MTRDSNSSHHEAGQQPLQQPQQPLAPHLKTSVIVPAFNEAGRITNVLKTIAAARLVDEIIVVTDGCEDSTAGESPELRALAAGLDQIRKTRHYILRNANSSLALDVMFGHLIALQQESGAAGERPVR